MLAAWFRIKYPHVVDMALAASAPLVMVSRETPETAFFQTVTNTFGSAGARARSAHFTHTQTQPRTYAHTPMPARTR